MSIIFEAESSKLKNDDTFVVEMPPSLSTEEEVCAFYGKAFGFPGYYTPNFDHLEDTLVDLSWIPQREIAVHHSQLPAFGDEVDATVYMRILLRVGSVWERPLIPDEELVEPRPRGRFYEHDFVAAFHPSLEGEVQQLLRNVEEMYPNYEVNWDDEDDIARMEREHEQYLKGRGARWWSSGRYHRRG